MKRNMDEYELGKLAGLGEALKAIEEAASEIDQPKELVEMILHSQVFGACIDAINTRRALIKG